MAIRVAIEITRAFDVQSDFETVFNLLADVPTVAGFFPKLESIESLGDQVYRWSMEKIGIDRHSVQVAYASRYEFDKEGGEIRWTPVEGEGNGLVCGKWQLQAVGLGETHLVFNTAVALNLPLPSLLKMGVSPVVKHEFNALVGQYMRNIQAHFEAQGAAGLAVGARRDAAGQ